MSFPFPTYLPIYTIAGIGPNRSRTTGLTLYEACKALHLLAQSSEDHDGCMIEPSNINDYTHIRCKGRCVSFWSGWQEAVRPMFGANEAERELILTWDFRTPRWFMRL
jgi:hypothetical protein